MKWWTALFGRNRVERESVARRRALMWLLTGFSAIALVMALVGVYGLLGYGVSLRTREIGVRLALGADRATVRRLVLREALTLTLAGLAVGTVAALLGARAMRTMVFGITSTDPLTFGAVAVIILGTALFASWLPARRAASVDPVSALRSD